MLFKKQKMAMQFILQAKEEELQNSTPQPNNLINQSLI
jgi:hypothetical protein